MAFPDAFVTLPLTLLTRLTVKLFQNRVWSVICLVYYLTDAFS
jgi:hypothetical protein